MVQWLRLGLPLQGVQVHSLVRELRSHMPCENKNINQNQYCNKFNKDLKKKKFVLYIHDSTSVLQINSSEAIFFLDSKKVISYNMCLSVSDLLHSV